MATFTRSDDLQGAEFVDADLRGARFIGHRRHALEVADQVRSSVAQAARRPSGSSARRCPPPPSGRRASRRRPGQHDAGQVSPG